MPNEKTTAPAPKCACGHEEAWHSMARDYCNEIDCSCVGYAPVPARMQAKINRNGPNGCWIWLGEKRNSRGTSGYGRAWLDGKKQQAHRVIYELLVGPIPDGLTLDHLCRRPSCVNPAHLEPVTCRENLLRGTGPNAINARKTKCPAGHAYTSWAIKIGHNRFIGVFWFTQGELPDYADGQRVALFSTRSAARKRLKEVKKPVGRGGFPNASVVRVDINITERAALEET